MKLAVKKTNDLPNQHKICKDKNCESPLRSNSKDKYCAQCRAKINAKKQQIHAAVILCVSSIGLVVVKKANPGKILVAMFKQKF